MIAKIVIVIFLIVIIYSLGSALYYLARERQDSDADSDRVFRALAWRIGLSVLLFILLFVAFALGWITPHSI